MGPSRRRGWGQSSTLILTHKQSEVAGRPGSAAFLWWVLQHLSETIKISKFSSQHGPRQSRPGQSRRGSAGQTKACHRRAAQPSPRRASQPCQVSLASPGQSRTGQASLSQSSQAGWAWHGQPSRGQASLGSQGSSADVAVCRPSF